MTDITINERLKAIRKAWGILIDEGYFNQAAELEAHLTAIQSTIDAAETDAGKLVQKLAKMSPKEILVLGKFILTAALLKANNKN